ncbi:MAG: histidine phosphatase family protein [Flavobacterium sp.]|nr:histidine phosphatase family protein [Flavobacterium sp.]
MKQLTIIRHGKSSWDFPVQDQNRPLIEKGILNSIKIGKESKPLISPNSLIWSSFAERAFSTAKIVVDQWNLPNQLIFIKDELYTFDYKQLERIIKTCPDSCDSLVVFGHNNAITDFVNKFGDIFIDNVPTSGLVSLNFDSNSWSTISKGKTNTILFPRDI